jgi:flagellar hook-associated protein 1 FlgK
MSTGLSALLAFQRALDTTSHNIANANTAGYVRQRTEFGARVPEAFGNGWVGRGVDVLTITRQYDQFLVAETRGSASSSAGLETFAALAERVNNLFGDSANGLAATLQRLQSALQGVATEPTSISARQVLIGEARGTVDRLAFFDGRLRDLDAETELRLDAEIGEVNSLAAGIARLNRDIATGFAATGQPPNDLLDERDRLLDQLASKVNVTLVPQDGMIVNVFVGRGQALVLNQSAARLDTSPDSFDAARSNIVLLSDQGAADVTGVLTGGTLGGLLDYRNGFLDSTRNALGRIAAGLADTLNTQHRAGQDLAGNAGTDLFRIGAVGVNPNGANAGSATLSVARSPVAALTGADYQLEFAGGAWNLRRLDTGAAISLTGTGTPADPLRADGLEIVVGGTPAAGDRFLIRPTREAVAGLAVAIADPARIAAGVPIRAEALAGNAGDAVTTSGEVLDPTDPQLRATVEIEFLTPTTYSVNGAGSFSFASGAPIEINGWRIAISGSPAAGDRFRVASNATGVGDNRNALALADALGRAQFDGGTTSLNGAVARLTSEVGSTTQQAQMNRDAQQLMYAEATRARENANGVNLDEEAANLLRFQQAYQAAAQLVRVAGQMFDALLDATR